MKKYVRNSCDQLFGSGCHAHEGNITDLMLCVYTVNEYAVSG